MSEHDLFAMESIPEFAMQPAREEPTLPEISDFDPTVYERLLEGLELIPQEETAEEIAEPEPAPEPETAPEPEPEPVTPMQVTGTVVSAGEDVETDVLRLVDLIPCEAVRIRVEEDILVPDTKPDLAEILHMDGVLQYAESERNHSGELRLQTLYVPQGKGADRSIIAIESRIPFQQGKPREGEETLDVKASAKLESLEYRVINERKFRVKAVVLVEGRQYRKRRLELFQGLKEDEVQMLQEKIVVTDVVQRKTEPLELEEDLMLPDAMPEVGKILRCDVTLTESHKQISRDKVVISGTAQYNVLYLPQEVSEEVPDKEPVLFQSKGEFTQFVPLGRNPRGDSPISGRVFFQMTASTAEPKESETGSRRMIHVTTKGDTYVELYCDVERRVVSDAYHHQKEMVFDSSRVAVMQLSPCGISETTVREVLTVPDSVEGWKRVVFLSGELRDVESRIEGGKNVTEGKILAKLVCLADGELTPFRMEKELPFRTASEIVSEELEMTPDNEIRIKELRYDRLNDRQIEINASVVVNGAVVYQKQCPMIDNVGFLEDGGPEREAPGLVLYISRGGDTLWKIARKYRTTIETLSKINGIEKDAKLEPETKLLIVK